jgi:prephenate dehydrogenase
MKSNNFAMKDWHLEHVEKVIIRFAQGLSADASSFEKRNYKKYGTITYCMKQIEYDMKHGVKQNEVMRVFRKVRLNNKYAKLRSSTEAVARLQEIEDLLADRQGIESRSGGRREEEKKFLWHKNAYRGI